MSENKRRALVTGGTRGIGAVIASRLRGDGYEVIWTGRQSVVDGDSPPGFKHVDFSDSDALADFCRWVGEQSFSVLVNNAGISDAAPIHRTEDGSWDRIMEINVTAPMRLCRHLVPAMMKAGMPKGTVAIPCRPQR